MKNLRFPKSAPVTFLTPALLSLTAVLITGCGASFVSPAGTQTASIHGTLHGGQQPIVGAAIQLYAAGSPSAGGGYGEGSIALIPTKYIPISDSQGNFSITGDYIVPPTASFFYIVATGGSPGVGVPNNPNITLLTTLGGCTPTVGLSPTTTVEINEVTTAAAVIALQQYLAPPGLLNNYTPAIGAPSSDINGLENAFQAVNNLVNTGTGVVTSPSVDPYATTDNGLLLNTVADILASCVNSSPLDSACATLFFDATPSGLEYPAVETLQAASYMARNPTNNIPALFGLIPKTPPFAGYTTAPNAFAVSLTNQYSACPVN